MDLEPSSLSKILHSCESNHVFFTIKDLQDILFSYFPPLLFYLEYHFLSNANNVTWHPGCWRVNSTEFNIGPIGRIGPVGQGSFDQKNQNLDFRITNEQIPQCLVMIIFVKNKKERDELIQLISLKSYIHNIESEKENQAKLNLGIDYVQLYCDSSTEVYHLLKDGDFFLKTFPKWYAQMSY